MNSARQPTPFALVALLSLLLAGCPNPGDDQTTAIPPAVRDEAERIDFADVRVLATIAGFVHDTLAGSEIERHFLDTNLYDTAKADEDNARYGLYLILKEKRTGRQIVAFRGTKTGFDIVRDLSADPTFYGAIGMEAHIGFGEAAKFAYEQIQSQLSRDRDTVLVGHSMGGAIADIVSHYLVNVAQFQPTRIKVVTFGQPKVSQRDYPLQDVTYLRVVNSKDPVPMLPPQDVNAGWTYHHFHRAAYLWSGGQWSFLPEADVLQNWDYLEQLLSSDLNLHFMDNYSSRLNGLNAGDPNTLVPMSSERFDRG